MTPDPLDASRGIFHDCLLGVVLWLVLAGLFAGMVFGGKAFFAWAL